MKNKGIRNLLPALPQRLRIWSGSSEDKAPPREDFILLEPDLEDILSERPPRILRGTHYVIIAAFVTLILVASLVHVDIIVAASGRLVADAPTIVVQPMQLSIIRELKVKSGDVIHKGDVVATLDPTFTQADKASLLVQQEALQAQIARIEAELNNRPLKLDGNSPERLLQLTLYGQRQSQFASRLLAMDEDIMRHESTIRATEENRVSLAQQLGVAKEVEGMRAKLLQLQAGSKLNYLDAQVVRMRNERDNLDASHRLNELRHILASKQAERQVFIDEWRRQLLEDLVKARTNEATVAENLVKAVRMNELVVLSAPADGIVLDVAKRSVGSVIQAAEPLITLVPTSAALVAEVSIASADVGYTRLGDEVAVKVDAFPYQTHGILTGRLRAIGEDSFSPNGTSLSPASTGPTQMGMYHKSQVELTGTGLHALPDGTHLIPGMSLTGEIKVGSRSVISFFLSPIRRGFSESIRET